MTTTKLSKAQVDIGERLIAGAMIRDEISGYWLAGRKIRTATIDRLLAHGWAVRAKIQPLAKMKIMGSVIVAAPGMSRNIDVVMFSDRSYGVIGRRTYGTKA